jgi:hypothetical protein
MKTETKYALISDAVYQRGAANVALVPQAMVPGACRRAISGPRSIVLCAEDV